jgi:hypothetical protein
MTQRFRRKASRLEEVTWSNRLSWYVNLDVDNRGNITAMGAVCTYGSGELATCGHAHVKVGPFDDVDEILEQLLVESALNTHEQMRMFD